MHKDSFKTRCCWKQYPHLIDDERCTDGHKHSLSVGAFEPAKAAKDEHIFLMPFEFEATELLRPARLFGFGRKQEREEHPNSKPFPDHPNPKTPWINLPPKSITLPKIKGNSFSHEIAKRDDARPGFIYSNHKWNKDLGGYGVDYCNKFLQQAEWFRIPRHHRNRRSHLRFRSAPLIVSARRPSHPRGVAEMPTLSPLQSPRRVYRPSLHNSPAPLPHIPSVNTHPDPPPC